MGTEAGRIHEKIKSFKKKYYLDLTIRGLILSASILLVYILLATILEHNLWLGPWARFLSFLCFILVAVYCIYHFLREPIQFWIARKGMTEEESARLIGAYIPSVKDRLLNFIQLEAAPENSLAYASILQKTREFEPLSFESIIDIRENRKYLKYLALPLAVVLIILVINRSILTSSAERIINFNREYSPEAPFRFQVEKAEAIAFFNEDFTTKITLEGDAIPANAYLVIRNQRIRLERISPGVFTYTFEKIQSPIDYQIEAAGFFSESFHVDIRNRPEVAQLKIELEYPKYLNRKNQQLFNVGNIEIPEGTVVTWNIKTAYADIVELNFASDSVSSKLQNADNQLFTLERDIRESNFYEIILQNDVSRNKDRISYSIDVIKDEFPSISVNNLKDSILYERILLGGMISDDHGISRLALHYKIENENKEQIIARDINIPVTNNSSQQNFFYNWVIDTLTLNPGDQLSYYLQVWDNDGVNGRKSTRSTPYTFLIPTHKELMVEIKQSQSKAEEKIEQSFSKAQKLQDQIDQASQKLKGKQTLNWQDKKMLEDIFKQKENLDRVVQQLQDENKLLEEKKEAFTEQDKRIKEKAEQIQKLMEELLDEETRKLFEELQKLMKENADVDDIQKLLNKLNQNSENLEKELERTLELFKDLQYDFKMDQTIKELNKQVEEQKKLLEKTERLEKQNSKGDQKTNEKKSDDPSRQDSQQNDALELAEEQKKLNEDVKENLEQLSELKKLGEELHKDETLPTEELQEELMKDQEESKEMLDKNEPSKAKTPQKKAIQKMQEMKQQMEASQSSMEMEMDMENLESLRQIVHGLVKLSYDQEDLMKRFAELTPNDPGFNRIAQNQLKLKDDAKVLEDSLLALGKRDPFMGSIITKEVGDLNNHLEKVIDANKERRRPQASTEMQATMTSINNLALMLDDHFEMLMEMMAKAKPGKGKKSGDKPSLSQMQEQLNQKIQKLKGSGKNGKELSEELAEMAAEQERIRKALQEMEKKMNDGKMPGGNLPGKMEETEMDLVNKQLTDQLIKRQQDILTRLLETEKSMREQDMDEERKGETAKDYEKEIPKAFEDYLRLKEKEVELLKTVPPKLYPYYKKEVSEYFKRMGK